MKRVKEERKASDSEDVSGPSQSELPQTLNPDQKQVINASKAISFAKSRGGEQVQKVEEKSDTTTPTTMGHTSDEKSGGTTPLTPKVPV